MELYKGPSGSVRIRKHSRPARDACVSIVCEEYHPCHCRQVHDANSEQAQSESKHRPRSQCHNPSRDHHRCRTLRPSTASTPTLLRRTARTAPIVRRRHVRSTRRHLLKQSIQRNVVRQHGVILVRNIGHKVSRLRHGQLPIPRQTGERFNKVTSSFEVVCALQRSFACGIALTVVEEAVVVVDVTRFERGQELLFVVLDTVASVVGDAGAIEAVRPVVCGGGAAGVGVVGTRRGEPDVRAGVADPKDDVGVVRVGFLDDRVALDHLGAHRVTGHDDGVEGGKVVLSKSASMKESIT